LIADKLIKINKIIIMNRLSTFLKATFHILNVFLITIYLFPGSLFGYMIYGDIKKQPQITSDFLNISSNHFYAFLLFSIIGILSYGNNKKKNIIIIYLFPLSIILELFHIIIPQRSFQIGDLLGNFLGVLFVLVIFSIYKKI
tara:strand:- start:255 stop:680 length:426 start_codon:yes stop_codon:yes gene_type:complete